MTGARSGTKTFERIRMIQRERSLPQLSIAILNAITHRITGRNGRSKLRLSTIASDINASISSVRSHLSQLEADGWLELERSPGCVTEFEFSSGEDSPWHELGSSPHRELVGSPHQDLGGSGDSPHRELVGTPPGAGGDPTGSERTSLPLYSHKLPSPAHDARPSAQTRPPAHASTSGNGDCFAGTENVNDGALTEEELAEVRSKLKAEFESATPPQRTTKRKAVR